MAKLLALALAALAVCTAQTPNELAKSIYKELIEINTTDSVGDCTKAANAMAARLKAAGFPAADMQVIGPDPRKGNLVARLRSPAPKRKPLLLLAHLDVVEAKRSDWSVDPFTFLEKDGYFYGRGTMDDKAQAAIWVATLIRLKQEGYQPDRDIILALTADEEGGKFNGAKFLVEQHRDLVDAAFCLNEGGSGQYQKGKRILNGVQASEKVFLSFYLETKNPGGHSSLPRKDNAIYQLSNALGRLERFEFPVRLNEVTQAWFERMANITGGLTGQDFTAVSRTPPDTAAAARLSANPYYNALLRTTCITTMLEAGHAENALPQSAKATVNCRVLPSENLSQVQHTLEQALADPGIIVTPIEAPKPSPPSPLSQEVMGAITATTKIVFPGVPVVPSMGTGATDSLYFRIAGIPAYGVSGLFHDVDDIREHGRDERIGIKDFYMSQEFLFQLVKALTLI